MATESERDVFASEVLEPVGKNRKRLFCEKLTGFLAMKGEKYEQNGRKLMIVGRSVNGWIDSRFPCELERAGAAKEFAEIVHKGVQGKDGCPMLWVTKLWKQQEDTYNTKRSAFWRAIRGVVRDLRIADVEKDDWPSHLVWSNLYKVAPADGGNPNGALCDIQRPGCVKLLEMELAEYKPERLLFFTGLNWLGRFREKMNHQVERTDDKYVHATGLWQIAEGMTTKVVVAAHPQGKNERELVEEVVKGFGG